MYDVINYDLCSDCIQAFLYDDFSGIPEDDFEEREAEIDAGLKREFCNDNFIGLSVLGHVDALGACDCCGVMCAYAKCDATFRSGGE